MANNLNTTCGEGLYYDMFTDTCLPNPTQSNIITSQTGVEGAQGVPGGTPEGVYGGFNSNPEYFSTQGGHSYGEEGEYKGRYNKKGKFIPKKDVPYNPYGDINLENSIYNFGRSLKDKDTAGAVGYGALSLLKLGRIGLSGFATENRNQYIEDWQRKQQRENMSGDFMMYADGGEVEKRLMPENYLTENSANGTPNAEVEDGEYIQNPDGSTQRVVGNTHEEGGVRVNLENNTRIISDNLVVGEKAQELSQKYGIKVSSSDTFAEVVDKINKRSGLEYLLSEKEEIIKKLRKQEEAAATEKASASGNTSKLNLNFLSRKLAQIDKDKAVLEQQQAEAVNHLFKLQEASKPTNQQTDDIDYAALASKYGVDEETAKRIVGQYRNGGLKKFEPGGTFVVEEGKTQTYTPEEKAEIRRYYQRVLTPESYNKLLEALDTNNVVVNMDFVRGHNMGEINVGKQKKGTKYHGDVTDVDAAGFTVKDWYKAKYGKDLDLLNKDELKKVQTEYQKVAKDVGIEYIGGSVASAPDSKFGNVTASYLRLNQRVKGTKKGKLDIDKLLETPDAEADEILKEYGLTKAQLEKEGKLNPAIKYLDIVPEVTAVTAGVQGSIGSPDDAKLVKKVEGTPTVEDAEEDSKSKQATDTSPTKQEEQPTYGMMFPDQTPPPPGGLEAPTFLYPRFARTTPNLVSTDGILQGIQDETSFAMGQAEKYADPQRLATQADIFSRATGATNEALFKTAQFNQAEQAAADKYNLTKGDEEEVARINALRDFEAKIYKAKDTTEEDYRNWLKFNKEAQIQNYNSTKNLELMNQLYGNVKYDLKTGKILVNGEWVFPDELQKLGMTATGNSTTKKEEEENNAIKEKKNGGYFYDKKSKKLKIHVKTSKK